MISLLNIAKNILTESRIVSPYDSASVLYQRPGNALFARGVEPPLFKIVVSDEKGDGFKDPKKRNAFFLTIERELKRKKMSNEMPWLEIDRFMDGLKYYPATDKIVGNLPKFMFKAGYVPSLKNLKLSKEIGEISSTIEIKQKK